MNWATTLEQIWHSPSFPMWLTLGVAGFFGLIVLITLLRASKSLANGALTLITLLAIALAATAAVRSNAPGQASQAAATNFTPSAPPLMASMPSMSCLDELAGETVLAACEKVVFGSAESTAAAVSYTAAQLNRLTAHGDVAAANKAMTAELASLRRAVERDRFGLVAYVLQTRDSCQIGACAVYASLTTRDEIAAHMEQRTYDTLVNRYAAAWNAPLPTAAAPGVVTLSGLPPSLPTGKPTNADFPTSASIPPVNIMTPEPPVRAARPSPAPAAADAQAAAPAAPKKQAVPKAPRPVQSAPVQLAPAPAAADN